MNYCVFSELLQEWLRYACLQAGTYADCYFYSAGNFSFHWHWNRVYNETNNLYTFIDKLSNFYGSLYIETNGLSCTESMSIVQTLHTGKNKKALSLCHWELCDWRVVTQCWPLMEHKPPGLESLCALRGLSCLNRDDYNPIGNFWIAQNILSINFLPYRLHIQYDKTCLKSNLK